MSGGKLDVRQLKPSSDEEGGTALAVTEGEKGLSFIKNYKVNSKILSFSLPQSASPTAPSSDGAKVFTRIFCNHNFLMAFFYLLFNILSG